MLAQAAVRHVFAPGETGDPRRRPGSSMFVVHNGRVRVQVNDNGRPRTVATLNEGDFFGEMALFTGEPRTANVVALEETEVLEIGHAAMKRVFDTIPDLVESLSFIMAERRQGLASHDRSDSATSSHSSGILSSIKRFFGLHHKRQPEKKCFARAFFLHFVLFGLFAAKFAPDLTVHTQPLL